MASNANQLHQITSQKFKSDIVVDINHCPNFVNKTNVQSKSVAFTVHIPFEQLKSWYDNKLSTLADYSYVQVLNAFLGKRYSLKIRENYSRLEECLRVNCTRVSKSMIRKHGGKRRRLDTKMKSIGIYQDELSTVALLSDLESKVSCLENENASIIYANRVLDTKFKEASTHISQIEGKFNKARVGIKNLRTKNIELFNIIEKIFPQRRFENTGKPFLDVGKRQQNRQLQTLSTRIEQALWLSNSFGLQLESVNLADSCGEAHFLTFGKEGLKSYKEPSADEQENVRQVLFIMDKFCIGEAAY